VAFSELAPPGNSFAKQFLMMPGNSSNAEFSFIPSPAPDWVTTLEFDSTFDEAKSQVLNAIRDWYPRRQSESLDLSAIEACVVIKNHERTVVRDNAAHRYFFASGRATLGKPADPIAQYKTTKLSHHIDELIAEGIRSLDCEHEAKDPEGQSYNFRTFKCQLDEFHDPNYFILSISRPIACLGKSDNAREKSIMDLLAVFQSLDATDQLTCRMDAKGESTKDIALAVRLSPRAIELRRKKMLELFDVQRPMELVRITIRLEEHGLLPN